MSISREHLLTFPIRRSRNEKLMQRTITIELFAVCCWVVGFDTDPSLLTITYAFHFVFRKCSTEIIAV